MLGLSLVKQARGSQVAVHVPLEIEIEINVLFKF